MSDDVVKRGSRGRTRINMGDDCEVRYWTDALRCTKEELEAAVEYLARRKRRRRRDLKARDAWLARARVRTGGRVLCGRY